MKGKPVSRIHFPGSAALARSQALHCFAANIALTLLCSACVLLSQPAHASDKQPTVYRLGIFPYMAPRQTVKFYGPIAADMERVLKHPVRLESQRSFSDFTRALDSHSYDIALIQPFDYPEVVENEGYIPLARLSVPLVTQFYVRSDSHYHTLEDLRCRRPNLLTHAWRCARCTTIS